MKSEWKDGAGCARSFTCDVGSGDVGGGDVGGAGWSGGGGVVGPLRRTGGGCGLDEDEERLGTDLAPSRNLKTASPAGAVKLAELKFLGNGLNDLVFHRVPQLTEKTKAV